MYSKPRQEYRLDLGGTIIGFHCYPPRFAEYLAHWFDKPSSETTSHIDIDFELLPHDEALHLPNTLLKNKTVTPDGGFDISNGLFRGHFQPTEGRGRIEAKAAVARGQLMRVMEQIFYQTFFSALSISQRQTVMIHSSAVIAEGQGFLFVGPSEAGKTTAALNSSRFHVLGDEMNLVHFTNNGLLLEGTPFNGTFRGKKPGTAPLKAVFLLNQAQKHGIRPLGAAEAGSILAAEVVPAVGLDEIPSADTIPRMVDAAARIIAEVPVLRLDLLPDPGFWNVIAKEFSLALV